jgi:hypothetical protein
MRLRHYMCCFLPIKLGYLHFESTLEWDRACPNRVGVHIHVQLHIKLESTSSWSPHPERCPHQVHIELGQSMSTSSWSPHPCPTPHQVGVHIELDVHIQSDVHIKFTSSWVRACPHRVGVHIHVQLHIVLESTSGAMSTLSWDRAIDDSWRALIAPLFLSLVVLLNTCCDRPLFELAQAT